MGIKVEVIRFTGGGIFTKFTPPCWYAYVEGVGAPPLPRGTTPSGGGGGPAPVAKPGGKPGGHTGPAGPGAPLPKSNTGPSRVNGPVSRNEVLDRARYWSNKKVPYSMGAYTNDPNGKSYRTDCSGLVSMALHLDKSYSTVTLPEVVRPIPKHELKPGDIVGNLGPGTGGAGGHVMVFNGWTDASMTKFRVIEETPPAATESVKTWGAAPYTSHAWRYKNIAD